MNNLAKPLVVPIAIYFPILIVVTPLDAALPYNKVLYSVVLMLAYVAYHFLANAPITCG